MVKSTPSKRLSTSSLSASRSIDLKARQRIEELYDLTDEIINAYNEINEKYVHQIYRKYQRLKEENKKLKDRLANSRCANCKHARTSKKTAASDASSDEDAPTKMSTSTSIITRSKKKNPFIISDIDETQPVDDDDTRFQKNVSTADQDKSSMDKHSKAPANIDRQDEADDDDGDEQDGDEEEEEDDADDNYELSSDASNSIDRLPLSLQLIIQRKAKKNKNAKAYLLEIPRYPSLCDFLRDKSRQRFDYRPTDEQVRPLIANHLTPQLANEAKIRMRVRDELREIHRSYLRTFMTDPRSGQKSAQRLKSSPRLPLKKSPQ